ncbi:hypothetical protein ACJ73_05890 [Blastomyces percursus]|uniref:Uncharacterized protein n=1 Tax=Blastomyces percursus TaxID=1658174 RepID=A0A1J9R555_9EURO|nr:hypothetical protein ACJ73_05890 [Blastomyces percursus]
MGPISSLTIFSELNSRSPSYFVYEKRIFRQRGDSVNVGIPSKLVSTYPSRDEKLKRGAASIPITGALDAARGKPSYQNLELSPGLLMFMDELLKTHDKPVTMLNLLHFHRGGKPEYYKYGQALRDTFLLCTTEFDVEDHELSAKL